MFHIRSRMKQRQSAPADSVVVLDFETSGLSPDMGDRVIEVGAVRMEAGRITDRFQSLMNPGLRVSGFIEDYTGITNRMLRAAPPCKTVMARLADFIADHDLVAHNAAFDQRFLDAECQRIRRRYAGAFACSMLAARRVYPDAPNHKLGTLVTFNRLPTSGTFHRALADAEMTAHLWLGMLSDIRKQYRIRHIPFPLMQALTRVPKAAAGRFLKQCEGG
jgi:DNA polymerase III subunit epsilon